MLKTIAVIPARGGSKRLPNKNIKLLNGKPLLVHSIDYANAHSFIDEVYVTTDSIEIKEIALQYGAKVIERPKSLSGDLEPTITAIKHVIENVSNDIENIILLQPTNPLRPKNLLEQAFSFFNKKKITSLFTVSRNHDKLGTINNNIFTPFNYKVGQRSQDLQPLFFENGLLYITKKKLIKQDVIISKNAYPFEVKHPFGNVDIDDQNDFDYANYLSKKHSED